MVCEARESLPRPGRWDNRSRSDAKGDRHMPRIGVARDGAEPSSADQKERHVRILDAAAHLATEHDLAHVQMTEVAKRAGVAIGTLYRYFPSKTHLFVGVMLHRLERFDGRRPAAGRESAPQDAICETLIEMTRELVAHPLLALAMLQSNSTAAAAAVSMTPPLKRSGRRTPTRATIRTASSWAWTA